VGVTSEMTVIWTSYLGPVVDAIEPFYASFVPSAPEPDFGLAQPVHHDLAFLTVCFFIILIIDKTLEYAGYFSDFTDRKNNEKIRETR
jgi:hypothetical protein